MCGKDVIAMLVSTLVWGSPPRVRERLLLGLTLCVQRGITPACAGKTLFLQQRKSEGGDHPRVCGKDDLLVRNYLKRLGSPPRVRERQKQEDEGFACRRITPACAGKTKSL